MPVVSREVVQWWYANSHEIGGSSSRLCSAG